jgi:hypothetical protein
VTLENVCWQKGLGLLNHSFWIFISHNTISYGLPGALQHAYHPIKFRIDTGWLSSKPNSWYSEGRGRVGSRN